MFRCILLGLAGLSVFAAAPEAKTTLWLSAEGPAPHDTYAHRDITLKGTSSESGDHIKATWDFGDGSAPFTFAVSKAYDVSAKHAYFGNPGDIFEARLTLTNTRTNESSTAAYAVAMREQSPAVEINIAIDEGLWRLHLAMHEGQQTELDRLAFETHGHSADGPSADAYTATLAAIKQARPNRAARATTLTFEEQYAIAKSQNADGSWTADSPNALMKMAKSPVTRDFGTGAVVNVSSSILATTSSIIFNRITNTYNVTLTLKNTSANPIAGPLHAGITGLAAGITLTNATGSFNSAPYIFVNAGGLAAGAQSSVVLRFAITSGTLSFGRVTYSGAFPPAALSITCPPNSILVNNPYTGGIDANGGALVYTFSTIGALPVGLTLNSSTGAITGSPTSLGLVNFTAVVTDSAGPVPQSVNTACSINVTSGNAAPTANGQSPTVQEDTPTTITLTGSDPESSPLTFSIVTGPTNGSLGPIVPIGPTSASVQYSPNLNYNGPDSFTFKVNDGTADSTPATVSINVAAVNDVPTFTTTASHTVNEDAGPQSVPSFITAISLGPANESGQTVSFNITGNTNPGLFSAAPAIAPNGTLTYTPAANANGTATITVTATDSAGATSPSQQFIINVDAVNDTPSFSAGPNQTVAENAGPQTVNPWATAISKGPANESSQTVDFIVSNNNNGFFSAQPAVSATGVLTYTAAAGASGVATVSVQIHDNGGTDNGGVDTSTPAVQFTITVNAVNDAPVVTNKAYNVQANIPIDIPAGSGLLTGITDADAGVNGCAVTFSLNTPSATTPVGGIVAANADGSFRFTPPAGATGNVSFTYTVNDNGCLGAATSAAATVTFTILGNPIWFVNASAAGGGNGTLLSPFNTLAAANGVDGANHGIFLFSGTYSGAITLNSGERFIGQGVSTASDPGFTTFDAAFGITPPAGSVTRPTINGTRPTMQSTVTLASNAAVRGLNLSTTTNTALSGGAASGVAVTEANITTTTGAAVNLNGTGGNFTFGSINTGAAATALTLSGTSGSFTVNGDGTGQANGSGGTINGVTAAALTATTAGGTITLKSMNVVLNTLATWAMLFDNNAGGTLAANLTGMSFTGVTASVSQSKALLQFETGGTANLTPNVQNSFFNGSRSYGVAAVGAGTSTLNVTVNQSGFGTQVNAGAPINQPGTSETNAPAIYMLVGNSASALVDYNITNNSFFGASGALGAVYGVLISGASSTAASHLNGTISGNRMGLTGSVGSGCSDSCAGIGLLPGLAGTFKSTVSSNTIRQTNSMGMNFANTAGAGASFTYALNFQNNTFAEPDTTNTPALQRAIAATPGNSGGAATNGCLAISGNAISGGWQVNNFIRISTSNTTGVMTIPGLGVNGATNAQVNAYVSGLNAAASVNTTVGGAINTTGGSTCP